MQALRQSSSILHKPDFYLTMLLTPWLEKKCLASGETNGSHCKESSGKLENTTSDLSSVNTPSWPG